MRHLLIDQVINIYYEGVLRLELSVDPGNLINIKSYDEGGKDPGFIDPEFLIVALKKANLLPGETNE